ATLIVDVRSPAVGRPARPGAAVSGRVYHHVPLIIPMLRGVIDYHSSTPRHIGSAVRRRSSRIIGGLHHACLLIHSPRGGTVPRTASIGASGGVCASIVLISPVGHRGPVNYVHRPRGSHQVQCAAFGCPFDYGTVRLQPRVVWSSQG